MNHIQKLKQMSGESFWRYIIKHKEDLKVILDNDSTLVVFIAEDEELRDDFASAHSDIGNRDGIFDLLAAIGIKAEYC